MLNLPIWPESPFAKTVSLRPGSGPFGAAILTRQRKSTATAPYGSGTPANARAQNELGTERTRSFGREKSLTTGARF